MSTHSATTGQIVLVCGATGRLAPLTPRLLSRGHQVLAATRDPASPAARRLRETGAHLIRADFADPASLRAAAVQASAVVAAGTAHAAGPAADTRHGRAIIDAAHAARTGHLVYVTAAGASQPTGVPVIDSKHAVEQHLRDSGVPHTIIAPAYFMENAWNPWNRAALAAGRWPSPVTRTRMLQQIPLADVLAFTIHVLESARRHVRPAHRDRLRPAHRRASRRCHLPPARPPRARRRAAARAGEPAVRVAGTRRPTG